MIYREIKQGKKVKLRTSTFMGPPKHSGVGELTGRKRQLGPKACEAEVLWPNGRTDWRAIVRLEEVVE